MATCEMGSPIIETDIMISFGVLKGGEGEGVFHLKYAAVHRLFLAQFSQPSFN